MSSKSGLTTSEGRLWSYVILVLIKAKPSSWLENCLFGASELAVSMAGTPIGIAIIATIFNNAVPNKT
jgi:hypothetical protein